MNTPVTVKMNAGEKVMSAVVQQRLRNLLDLAVAVGRREGLLGSGSGAEADAGIKGTGQLRAEETDQNQC